VVYKLDKDFNLLDEHDHYIMTSHGQHVRLSHDQVNLLQKHGLFV
jgi:hypothetical protein